MATDESKIMDISKQFKKWSMITLAILVISVFIRLSFTRFPFFVVFTWVAFLFVIPYVWEIYGKEAIALEFWVTIFKFFLKFLCSLFIFLLIRGYVAYLVDFGIMTAQTIGEKTGVAGWLERNPPEVLFEATFLLLVGYTVLVFVYKHGESGKKKWPRNVVVGILLTCMMVQIFMFASGNVDGVAMAAMQPVKASNSISKIENSGVVGGGAKIAFAFLFGESRPSMPNIIGANKVGTPQILFTKTYTEADLGADNKVEILDFAKTQVLPGDVFMIYVNSQGDYGATVDFSDGDQLKIRNGGNLRCDFEASDDLKSGSRTVSFVKGHGIKVRTELIRNS